MKTSFNNLARYSAPTLGKLHQISPHPIAPSLSSILTNNAGRSFMVPKDVRTGLLIAALSAKTSRFLIVIGFKDPSIVMGSFIYCPSNKSNFNTETGLFLYILIAIQTKLLKLGSSPSGPTRKANPH